MGSLSPTRLSSIIFSIAMMIKSTLAKVIKGRVSYRFHKIFKAKLNKKSEICIKAVENIDEFEQISLLTTCTTQLHIIGLPYIFWIFTKNFPKISLPPFYYPLFITFPGVLIYFCSLIINIIKKALYSNNNFIALVLLKD